MYGGKRFDVDATYDVMPQIHANYCKKGCVDQLRCENDFGRAAN